MLQTQVSSHLFPHPDQPDGSRNNLTRAPRHVSLKQYSCGPRMWVPSLLPGLLGTRCFGTPLTGVQLSAEYGRAPPALAALVRRGSPAPRLTHPPGGWDGEGWGTSSGGRVVTEPSVGPAEAPSLRPPVPPAPRGGAQPGPAPPSRPLALTETQEPPSWAVDALAAVSLGSTERQQPLAATGAKRRQQPAPAGVAGRAGGVPGLTWPRPPAAPPAQLAQPGPGPTPRPLPPHAPQQEPLRLDRKQRGAGVHSVRACIRGSSRGSQP